MGRIFFVGINFFVGEEWEDLHDVVSTRVNVASVSNGGATGNIAREQKTWHADTVDCALADSLAGDFGVDEMGGLVDFLNIHRSIGGTLRF